MTGLSSAAPAPGSARISASVVTIWPVRLISLMSEPAQNALLPAPAQHRDAHLIVGRDLLPDFAQPLLGGDVERVEHLGPVERDDRHAIGVLLQQDRHLISLATARS